METVFGYLGLLGGLLAAAGDVLLDLKGRGNKKLGSTVLLRAHGL